MEERKFVCKYCNKRFPCGKSLGGHIRTHMMSSIHHHNHNHSSAHANNVASSGGVIKFDSVRKRKRDFLGSEDDADDVDGDGSGKWNSLIYGLRENPKKTMRFVNSNATLQQLDKFCKECGKCFPSLKALCGHMACHSEKEKPTNNIINNNNNRFDNNNICYSNNNNNNSSGISEKQKLVMDSQSDTETSAPRRSKRMMRFNTLTTSKKSFSSAALAVANAATLGNDSSSVSEVEQEQEEVARCLMMLSKDNTHQKGRFALFTESSDNNSVVLEAKWKSKSPSADTKLASATAAAISNGKVKDSVTNGYCVVDKKLDKYMHRDMKKLKYDEADYDSNNSDSGYFRYGPKKVDSDDSSEEVNPSRKDFRDYDFESRKINLSRGGRSRNNTVFKKLVLDDSAKRKQNYDDSFGRNSLGIISSKKTLKNQNGFVNDKGWKYECLKSERDNNNNNNGSDYDSAFESDENSTDTESYPAPKAQSNGKSLGGAAKKSGKAKKKKKAKLKLKKNKEHECPICNKIFRSGQALGGHKRSHFVGGSEENTLVIRTSAPNHNHNLAAANSVAVPCLIDLNLPAPFDE